MPTRASSTHRAPRNGTLWTEVFILQIPFLKFKPQKNDSIKRWGLWFVRLNYRGVCPHECIGTYVTGTLESSLCSPPGQRQSGKKTGPLTVILMWASPEHSPFQPYELWLPDSRMEKNTSVLEGSHPSHVIVSSQTEQSKTARVPCLGKAELDREAFTALFSWYEIVCFVLTEPGDHF